MVEIIRGIRLEHIDSVIDDNKQYKVIIPLAPVIVGDQVVQGRECSAIFGNHRNHKMPRWNFPTLQPKDDSDRSIPKAEDLDPLYVTKTVLGLVKLEMPTNLWYTILRGIEEEFQNAKFRLSNIVENQNIRDYRDCRRGNTAGKYGLENQIYVHPQHYNKELYAQDGKNHNTLLPSLQPGQWNTIDVLRSEFRIPIEPDRLLCQTSASALLAPHSKHAAKIAIDAQVIRMIDLLFRDSTKSDGPNCGVNFGSECKTYVCQGGQQVAANSKNEQEKCISTSFCWQ